MKNIRPTWKALADQKALTSADMAALALIKAVRHDGGTLESATLFLRKTFTPVTNKTKLDNGHAPWLGLVCALKLTKTKAPCMLGISAEMPEELEKLLDLRAQILSKFNYWGGGEL